MSQYTVIVRYPERLRDPNDMYYAAQIDDAVNIHDAMTRGVKEAWLKQPSKDRGKLNDWTAVLVFAGHPRLEYIA